jgi:hypothetical protein
MEELLRRMLSDGRQARILLRRIQDYQKLAGAELSNTYRLEQALPAIRRLVDGLSDAEHKCRLLEWCAQQEAQIRGLKDDFRFRFGSELKERLERQGLALSGQLPVLHAGRYTIRLDFDTGSAALYWGPEIERIRGRVRLAAEEIERVLADFDGRLKARPFKPQEFLKLLGTAYDRFLYGQRLVPGSRVLLVDLLREIAFLTQPRKFALNPVRDNFQDYSRIQFGYDLFRLRQSEQPVLDGRRLRLSVATFDSTTEKARSLWVPDNEQGSGTYYSYLSFAEEDFCRVSSPPESGSSGGETQSGNRD